MDEFTAEGLEVSNLFHFLHRRNIEGSKFKLGDKIKIRPETKDKKSWLFDKNGEYEITGINWVGDEEGYEYSAEDIPYLLWESELMG